MPNVSQPSSDPAQRTVEALQTVASAAFSTVERLGALNAHVARTVFEEGAARWAALIAPAGAQDLSAMGALPQPIVDKAIAYPREVYAILSETGASMFTVVEAQAALSRKDLAVALDNAVEAAPGGTAAALTAARSALDAATRACDGATQVTKQVAEVAHVSIVAAMDAASKAVAAARDPSP